jgi:uncharacterized protein YbjT (DUF2867 family)
MSNTVNWAPTIASDRTVYAPLGDLPVACIDPLDIATVACHLLTEPGPAGQAYPLTGPDAITPREQAATLAELIGHPITFVETSPEQARKTMVSYGMPDLLADAVIASMTGPLHGHGQTPMPTVEQVTGVPARNYRTWAAAHLDAFTAPAAW